MDEKPAIPFYHEINDFLESIPSSFKTTNPDFFCLRLKANEQTINNYKPPFRKGFYFVGLVTNAGQTKISYDNTDETRLDSFLVFQSPGLLYSFQRDRTASGFLIYFKSGCFSFFRPDFDKEFPFFHVLHTNFFKFNQVRYKEFEPAFEEVFQAYEKGSGPYQPIASLKLLALLYQLKDFASAFTQWEQGFTTPQQLLVNQFVQLINNYYTEKRTIEEYADLLHVTPNHLSQSVKQATGRNALGFITDRVLAEAKSLIQFTTFDISEIAYRLNFSDPANFGKFFKKHAQMTPLEYRKKPRLEPE